jgi:DNA polymerase-3 subunit epsilon
VLVTVLRAPAFAVVDVETTGLEPGVDRVVEVAVVRTDGLGRVTHEYASAVDPGGPVRLTEVHGLDERALRGAPGFAQVAAALAARLTGAVLVGHNVAFDIAFLRAEYELAGARMPVFPAICTRQLGKRLDRQPSGWNLTACCADAGVAADLAHTALGDARSTARLLAAYLGMARARGADSLAALGCEPLTRPPSGWRTGVVFSGRQQRRSGPASRPDASSPARAGVPGGRRSARTPR